MSGEVKHSQCDEILLYLQECGSITPLDALREFSCLRLGARIWDLRHKGYTISSSIETAKNRFGKPVHYARHTLITNGTEGEEDYAADNLPN